MYHFAVVVSRGFYCGCLTDLIHAVDIGTILERCFCAVLIAPNARPQQCLVSSGEHAPSSPVTTVLVQPRHEVEIWRSVAHCTRHQGIPAPDPLRRRPGL